MRFRDLALIVTTLLIVIFAVQNITATEVNLFFWKFSISRVLVIVGSFLIGVLAGVLIAIRNK